MSRVTHFTFSRDFLEKIVIFEMGLLKGLGEKIDNRNILVSMFLLTNFLVKKISVCADISSQEYFLYFLPGFVQHAASL